MTDIQYFHAIFQGYTVALMLPDKEDLLDLTEPFFRKDFPINIGIARLAPGDQYSKKIGREVSSKKFLQYYAKLFKTYHHRDIIKMQLEIYGRQLPFRYVTLQVHKTSEKVYFLGASHEYSI